MFGLVTIKTISLESFRPFRKHVHELQVASAFRLIPSPFDSFLRRFHPLLDRILPDELPHVSWAYSVTHEASRVSYMEVSSITPCEKTKSDPWFSSEDKEILPIYRDFLQELAMSRLCVSSETVGLRGLNLKNIFLQKIKCPIERVKLIG